jgi:hypothetical protein
MYQYLVSFSRIDRLYVFEEGRKEDDRSGFMPQSENE